MKHTKRVLTFLSVTVFLFFFGRIHAQFSFVHISDLHVGDGNPIGLVGNCDPQRCAIQVLPGQVQELVSPNPHFVVATGDISNVGNVPPDGMYNAITRHLFPHPYRYPMPGDYFINLAENIPIYFTPGNHEYYEGIVPPIFLDVPTCYAENIFTRRRLCHNER